MEKRNYTKAAENVLKNAEQIAAKNGSGYVGTEHLLVFVRSALHDGLSDAVVRALDGQHGGQAQFVGLARHSLDQRAEIHHRGFYRERI